MIPSADLMAQCAPNVAPQTLVAIIQVESGGNPYAINVNGLKGKQPRPKSYTEAVSIASYYIAKGYSVDLGLMQINSRNLKGLGYTVDTVLSPCVNLRAGSRILQRGYSGAVKQFGSGQVALRAALSAYNTGNYRQGFRNGYVAKYYKPANIRIIARSTHAEPSLAYRDNPVSLLPFESELLIYSHIDPPTVKTIED